MSTFNEAEEEIKKTKEILEGEHEVFSHPDAKKHLYVSLAKSAVRIVAGVCLIVGLPIWCGVGLIVAETLGIVEEVV